MEGRASGGWKKLPLGVDGSRAIVVHVLTDGNADDAKAGLNLIEAGEGDFASVTADAAYDTMAIYEAAAAPGSRVIVPATKTATISPCGNERKFCIRPHRPERKQTSPKLRPAT